MKLIGGTLSCVRRWQAQRFGFRSPKASVAAYSRYLSDWRAYSSLPGAERIHLVDTVPQLHDWTSIHELDAHYFYANSWTMRRVLSIKPAMHVDVASQTSLPSLLSAVLPVTFIDYRPLDVKLDRLTCIGGDILALPFDDNAIESLSCVHVAEHIGLGRYGDPLDPLGTKKAAWEMARILAPGGSLFFVVPVGRQRVCFNAHRIHMPRTICEYFADLQLVEFSGVKDNGTFVEHVDPAEFEDSSYGCGMFWFKKATSC